MGILTVSPLENPEQYDHVVLAEEITPGICLLVNGGGRPYKWDRKDSAGAQGVTTTYRGWRPSDGIRFLFQLWTSALIEDFYKRIIPVVAIDAEKQAPQPISIYHPVLFANDIFWVTTENIGPLKDEGKQMWSVAIEFSEYRQAKPKNVTSTPTNANTAAGNPQNKPTVKDKQDEEIERLRREFERPL